MALIAVFGIKKKEETPPAPPVAEQKAPEPAPAPAPLAPASAPQQPSDDRKVKEETGKKLLTMAGKALQKNDLTEARKYLDEARALMPDSKDLLAFEKQLEKAEKQALQRQQRQEEEQRKAEERRKEEQAREERRLAEEERRKKAEEEKKRPREIARDGRFIAFANGTVLDTRTNLMWAAKDNGSYINWNNAKSYCENYRGGGYTDWRMPTQEELAGLYDAGKSQKVECGSGSNHIVTDLIHLSCYWVWASETRGSEAAYFHFHNGYRHWNPQSDDLVYRALPVRSGK